MTDFVIVVVAAAALARSDAAALRTGTQDMVVAALGDGPTPGPAGIALERRAYPDAGSCERAIAEAVLPPGVRHACVPAEPLDPNRAPTAY